MKAKSLLLSVVLVSQLHAQQAKNDPFVATPGTPKPEDSATAPSADPSAEDSLPRVISICYETFSLPLSAAATLQREGLSDQELYQRMLDGMAKETVKQESLTVTRTRSGERVVSESVSEYIYPAEWEPAELPNQVGFALAADAGKDGNPSIDEERLKKLQNSVESSAFSSIATPATPTSFETRNLGLTFEAEAMLGEDSKTIDLRLSPEHVALADLNVWGQEKSETREPEIESQRVTTGVTVTDGQVAFLGTMNRSPVSKLDLNSAQSVVFAFVTPKVVFIRP